MAGCCDTNSGFPDAGDMKDLARDHKTITAEICAIQQAILEASSQCQEGGGQYCTIVAGDSPMTFIEEVDEVIVTNGGSDYFPVTAEAIFDHPTGTGATAEVIVDPSGGVNNFVITNGGSGYDPIRAEVDTSGGGDGQARIEVSTDDDSGAIVSTNIVNGGTSYTVGTALPVSHPEGTGADLEVSGVSSVDGAITAVRINDGGQDYQTINTTVEVDHPTGIGFEGVVQVSNDEVTGVSVQDPGVGYQDLFPIAIIIDLEGTGSGVETAVGVDTNTGEVILVDVIDGGANYSQNTEGQIVAAPTSDGTGATIDVVVTENIYGTEPIRYYNVVVGNTRDAPAQDQIDQVISYFTKLGYSIEVQVNPDTNSTIQWLICW